MNMKNKILALLSLVLIIGFSACTKTEYVDRGEVENPNKAYVATLTPNNWKRVSNALVQYEIPLSALTDYYILQGGVAVALSFDGEERIYSVLPSTFDGLAYSVDYEEGWVVISIDDPLADDGVMVNPPTANVQAKIILSTTDFFNYTGFFNSPSTQFDFKPLNLDPAK